MPVETLPVTLLLQLVLELFKLAKSAVEAYHGEVTKEEINEAFRKAGVVDAEWTELLPGGPGDGEPNL